jgi:transposase
MAKRRFTLSEQERQAFKQAEGQGRDAHALKRLQAVRLYGEGQPTQTIEQVVGCSWRSLLEYCQRYRAEGLAGLRDRRRGGNRAKLTPEQRLAVRDRLHQYRPDQILPAHLRVSQGVFWTVSDLRVGLQVWYGVTYQSPTSYLTLLHECRMSQHRPEKQYRSRPSELEIADFEARLEKK